MKTAKPERDEHGIRLGEGQPRRVGSDDKKLRKLSSGARRILQIAAQSRKGNRPRPASRLRLGHAYQQRASVRVTYAKPKSEGHWKAHGFYMQREAAAGKVGGFSQDENGVSIPNTLQAWQSAEDPRLFKLILSPENGARLDMEQYTRDWMRAVGKDLGLDLEWVAAVHTNTDHPHVHVAVRGMTRAGREVRFAREFIKDGFRFHAEKIATQKLGFRSERDIQAATVKEISQDRVTSLDRQIARVKPKEAGLAFRVRLDDPQLAGYLRRDVVHAFALERRLEHLSSMGLAKPAGEKAWEVQAGFLKTLQTVQAVGDKQKMMARHMEAASDVNLPVVFTQWKDIELLQGRVLGHGEEEGSGKRYLLLEGTDGRVYHLPQSKTVETLRSQNKLRIGELLSMERIHGRLRIEELGQADQALKSVNVMNRLHRVEVEGKRPGWLGRLDDAMEAARRAPVPVPVAHAPSRESGIRKTQPLPPKPGQDEEIAVRLSEEQVRLLIGWKFPDVPAKNKAAYAMTHEGSQEAFFDGRVELFFDEERNTFGAMLDRNDKPMLDAKLSELQIQKAPQRQAKLRNRDREDEHER